MTKRAFTVLVIAVLVVAGAALADPPARDPVRQAALVEEAARLGSALSAIFAAAEDAIRPGQTTRDIDVAVQAAIARQGVESMFRGFGGYPATTDTSVNEEVLNTPPSSRPLRDGDLLKLQIGLRGANTFAIQGWTYAVGRISADDERLLQVGREALRNAVAAARAGARTGDISSAIQSTVEAAGFSVDRDFLGFAIDTKPHADPPLPGLGRPHAGARLFAGQILSPFVILHAGRPDIRCGSWSCVSKDGRRSAVFSQMIVVQPNDARALVPERPVGR